MADVTSGQGPRWPKISKAWATSVLILVAVAIFDPAEFMSVVSFAWSALLGTLPFIAFAVFDLEERFFEIDFLSFCKTADV